MLLILRTVVAPRYVAAAAALSLSTPRRHTRISTCQVQSNTNKTSIIVVRWVRRIICVGIGTGSSWPKMDRLPYVRWPWLSSAEERMPFSVTYNSNAYEVLRMQRASTGRSWRRIARPHYSRPTPCRVHNGQYQVIIPTGCGTAYHMSVSPTVRAWRN